MAYWSTVGINSNVGIDVVSTPDINSDIGFSCSNPADYCSDMRIDCSSSSNYKYDIGMITHSATAIYSNRVTRVMRLQGKMVQFV